MDCIDKKDGDGRDKSGKRMRRCGNEDGSAGGSVDSVELRSWYRYILRTCILGRRWRNPVVADSEFLGVLVGKTMLGK